MHRITIILDYTSAIWINITFLDSECYTVDKLIMSSVKLCAISELSVRFTFPDCDAD